MQRLLFLLFVIAPLLLITSCATKRRGETLSSMSVSGKGYPNSEAVAGYGYLTLTGVSTDSTYGFSPDNPIQVARESENGSKQQSKYLNALRGPKGEKIYFERIGSCCPFNDSSLPFGGGLLDKYHVKVENGGEYTLYLDLYRSGSLLAPVGFSYLR